MKKITSILAFVLLIAGSFSACSDWLDVRSDELILEEDAFSTSKGYRTALMGIYKMAASPNLYGQELTWGLTSVMAYNYMANQLPSKYKAIFDEGINSGSIKSTITNIWETAYTAIANCNNLIQNLEKTDLHFEYEWEKDMIMAEAKALRALFHFEILRLFAPAPAVAKDSSNVIPYVTNYPNIMPSYKSTQEIIKNIVNDLEIAREMLRPIDIDIMWKGTTLSNVSSMLFLGIQNLLDDGERGNGRAIGFFCFRGYRMNYWGVTGLLARVHSYNRENDKAYVYANEIITDWIDAGKGFGFATWQRPNNNPNMIDGKRYPESLITFWNSKVAENYSAQAGTGSLYKMIQLTNLFGGDINEDYRYTALVTDATTRRYKVWNDVDDAYETDEYINMVRVGCPVLEIPEMYYIKAEYLAEQGEFEQALATLKIVKNNRNITSAMPSVSDYESFMELLLTDQIRDNLTRGNSFFYLKKLNWSKRYGLGGKWEAVPEGWYVLPIPESESMF